MTLTIDIVREDTVFSTMDAARARLDAGAPAGTLVLAREQTAGRGRKRRAWSTLEGAFAGTLILRPDLAPERAPRLTLLAGAAVCDAALAVGADVHLKWPNDVVIDAGPDAEPGPLGTFRKVAGVLVEGVIGPRGLEGALVGLGVNVARPAGGVPTDLRTIAATLADAGGDGDSAHFERALVAALSARMASPDDDDAFADALALQRARSFTLGRPVEAPEDGVRGTAVDLEPDGVLVVETPDGQRVRVVAGDVVPTLE